MEIIYLKIYLLPYFKNDFKDIVKLDIQLCTYSLTSKIKRKLSILILSMACIIYDYRMSQIKNTMIKIYHDLLCIRFLNMTMLLCSN